MTLFEDPEETARRVRGAIFPAYASRPADALLIRSTFLNPLRTVMPKGHPLASFELLMYQHDSFAAEWPLPVDVPTALRGFRSSLGMSQVKFAQALGLSRVNIERWEGGHAKPFRGHVHTLLSLVRPLAVGPLPAGQLLNLVAAAVCPKLTRPAATYSGSQIRDLLIDRRDDHGDLAPALLSALVSSRVLIVLDEADPEVEAEYIPAVGVRTLDRSSEPWDAEVRSIAGRLSPEDRKMWMMLGERLSRAQGSE
ncbi:helix-turn-helix domain-containing protein [Kribbella antiqua]|uniref:helix-turn-helix domain-containing protein n=1 Tax=Kribbella antiqua TaxID=2512217 RepID=UPI00104E4608|nr:helix-turn-helix transcriptional regulator [Kribbella antiqua]